MVGVGMPRDVLSEPVSKHMKRELLVLDSSSSVHEAARLMRERGLGSALVSRGGEPVGIVTERDILYRVVAEGRDPRSTPLGDVMSSPLIKIDESAKLSDAIAVMASRGIRRIVATSGGRAVGLVTLLSVVGDIVGKAALMPEVEEETGVRCPYCGSLFMTPTELSRHVDRVHIGAGLLEGDVSRW